MCRVLSYLGKPLLIEELLYRSDNSFIKQSYHPKYMSHLLNLAGFGMSAWDRSSHQPEVPFQYKIQNLPFYDDNLRSLSRKITANCLLAHLRGVPYRDKEVVSLQNVHPFIFKDLNIALAHNGALHNFETMKYDLLEYVRSDYIRYIHGTTDSEWIYAIFLSQLPINDGSYTTNEIIKAIYDTLKILQHVREKHKIMANSPVNLFISNGEFIAATRFVFDYGWPITDSDIKAHSGYHSLWYTYGESYGYYDNEYRMKGTKRKRSIIISSEPLTEDATTWVELPEYTLIIAREQEGEIKIITQDINL